MAKEHISFFIPHVATEERKTELLEFKECKDSGF
jgi:hypothetical protein